VQKKFYRKFHRERKFQHQGQLQLTRTKSLLGNPKMARLRSIWRSGKIKGGLYSANLFVLRFIARISHMLYFSGFTTSLELANHLVTWGFVTVNGKVITNCDYVVPIMTPLRLCLPNPYRKICYFMLFPYHRIFASPYLEINWKLFIIRFIRIPTFREVILPESPFDHMFLYEQLAQSIK